MSTPLSSLGGGDGDLSRRKRLVQQAQTHIDEEINARYLPVCALRTKRNALSPISRLPDDLLAIVFIFYARRNRISEWNGLKHSQLLPRESLSGRGSPMSAVVGPWSRSDVRPYGHTFSSSRAHG
jgi:hypothetical protein